MSFKSALLRKSELNPTRAVQKLGSCLLVLALLAVSSSAFAASWASNRVSKKTVADEQSYWEVRTAPVAMFARWFSLDLAYRFGSGHFSTGPSAISYAAEGPYGNMFLPTYNGHAFGWHATYYFKPTTLNTWYLRGHAFSEEYKNYPHGGSVYEERKGTDATLVVGYSSGMNWWKTVSLSAGLGAKYINHHVVPRANGEAGFYDLRPEQLEEYDESQTMMYTEIKLGIAF